MLQQVEAQFISKKSKKKLVVADRLWSNNFIQGVIAGGFCALHGAEGRQIKVAGAYSQILLQPNQAANGCLSRGPHEKAELMKNRQIGFL